jgi:hypothetical protein
LFLRFKNNVSIVWLTGRRRNSEVRAQRSERVSQTIFKLNQTVFEILISKRSEP